MVTRKSTKDSKFLYESIVENISNQISSGLLKPGDKLASVRKLSLELNVSKNTILQAYTMLENLGHIESKSQSGFYVRKKIGKQLPEIESSTLEATIQSYDRDELIIHSHEIASMPNLISLGGGVPSADMLPAKKINRIMGSMVREVDDKVIQYEFPPGYYKLRSEIAKISNEWGGDIAPDDVIITTGAIEAISLALKSIAKPGDTIITESPTFYLIPQILKSLNLKILEIPTHPKNGIDIKSLKKEMKNCTVVGCILYPTINSPLGSIMPQSNREELYELFEKKELPIIECDIWGELHFLPRRPKPIKTIDKKGLVLYITSLTKTGAPGLRIGWIFPGRYYKKVKELKYAHTIATSTLSQMTAAEYIKTGTYSRSIRKLRNIYKERVELLYNLISEYFPNGTKITKPQGGPFLWTQLPNNLDTVKLQNLAIKERITFNPGPIFTTQSKFNSFMRLSCVCRWNYNEIENAIRTLGNLCIKL